MNEFVQQWGGLVLGSLGTLLSLATLVSNGRARRREQRRDSAKLLDEAWDILAGRQGSSWIFEQRNKDERLVEARRLIERAISLDDRYPRAHMYLGVYWQFMEDYKRALICHQRAIELDRTYASAYNNLGRTYGQLGNSKDELESYRLALKYDGDCAYAHYNLGVALFEKGDSGDAISELEWVTSRRHCPAEVFLMLGNACAAAGQEEKAQSQYQTAKAITTEEARSRRDGLFSPPSSP
jgi:tetratricopeptide (TPR) repeat protein